MNSINTILLPTAEKIMTEFGNNLKLARRRLSAEQVAERADIVENPPV